MFHISLKGLIKNVDVDSLPRHRVPDVAALPLVAVSMLSDSRMNLRDYVDMIADEDVLIHTTPFLRTQISLGVRPRKYNPSLRNHDVKGLGFSSLGVKVSGFGL